jgi:hypothetical protein
MTTAEPKAKKPKAKPDPAGKLAKQIEEEGLPTPEREYLFHDTRKWRADFAFVGARILVEVEGGTWVNGRHGTGIVYRDNCLKYNAATLAGWQVYRFTTDLIRNGEALATIKAALRQKGWAEEPTRRALPDDAASDGA